MARAVGASDGGLSDTTRAQAFSDGVFAIIITLLVLDLHVPEHQPGQLWQGLAGQWPSYVAFAASFLYVGTLWLNHHGMLRHLARVDIGFQWCNLGLLFGAVIIPFPTSVVADTFNTDTSNLQDQRYAVLLYSVLAMFMSATWLGMWLYLAHHPGLLDENTDPDWARNQLSRPIVGIVLFGVGGLATWFVSPALGLVAIAAMIAYHAVTTEGVRPRTRPGRRGTVKAGDTAQ